MTNTLQVTTILGCKNSMLREGIKHILSSTRYKIHPEDVSLRGAGAPQLYGSAPFLFIIDSNLYPNGMGNIVRELKAQYANARVVILADGFDLEGMKLSLQAGADGYCLATTGCEALIKYLDLVMLGEVVLPSSAFLNAVLPADEAVEIRRESATIAMSSAQGERSPEGKDSVIRTLSSREAEILHCLMEGAPNKVIARKLEVAEATVKVHIKAILRKIRVANRTQAAMWAVSHMSGTSQDAAWAQMSDRASAQADTYPKAF
ncbi:LuxR C-terminal-related transcriptional regulator [Microvirga guangxiensis]|uniref:Two component transcriptional regulator, LuxR family n=1 Tax=Microvirga guangxiensis TaxID=549386 RepID=A0A1G5CLN0_9HYPH|nr:response regulator transcription factor [Microvirga guangxiensis]SCY03296.1 two component transcriptional regulator, LuxR family [Microvirga guangxiensis]